MADERGNAAGGVLVAFTLGALVGAVVALLFAPAKGEETREMIGEKARESAQKEDPGVFEAPARDAGVGRRAGP